VASSRAGSVLLAALMPLLTALTQLVSLPSTQLNTVSANPTSLPPMVMLTRSVLALSEPSWLASTSLVVAPPQAAKLNDDTSWVLAQSWA
jgi:hypothetical protein